MVEKSQLIVWLITWVVIVAIVLINQWSKKTPGIGLPTSYLIYLSVTHWFAALIYALPWYYPTAPILIQSGTSLENVTAGFIHTTYGVIGFGIGSVIIAPLVAKNIIKIFRLHDLHRIPNIELHKIYLFLGLLFYFILSPLLGSIPSIGSVVNSGLSLIIVGLSIACWKSWCIKDKKKLTKWLVIACCLPILTTFGGFLHFGSKSLLLIIFFVFNFYRPRWQLILALLLSFYIGLSVFTTYMRDRTELRWYAWDERHTRIEQIERIWQTVTSFEFFDIHKQEHLEAIDKRLNQNTLVGQSVEYMSTGTLDYAQGETIWQASIAWIPRIIWPDKPASAGGNDLVSKYTGRVFDTKTSVGIGQVLEFYINFGKLGIIFGFMILGTLIRIIDIIAAYKLVQGNWVGFASWFIIGISLIQVEGSIVELSLTLSASIVLVYLLNKFYFKKSMRGKILSSYYSRYESQ